VIGWFSLCCFGRFLPGSFLGLGIDDHLDELIDLPINHNVEPWHLLHLSASDRCYHRNHQSPTLSQVAERRVHPGQRTAPVKPGRFNEYPSILSASVAETVAAFIG
jgi:hypothetical protein